MKAICIAMSDRPALVKQCLESLAMNDLGGWTLYASCDMECNEIFSMLENFKTIPVVWWRHIERVGPELNTFEVCNRAMEDGTEALLYGDDDMVYSPDAIDLCNWYLVNGLNAPEHAGLCLCTDASDPMHPDSISAKDSWRGLVGQGYFYTKDQWSDFVKPNFFYDDPKWEGHGYDWSLGYRVVELGKIILRPRLSRSQHRGTYGHHEGGKIFPEHIATGRGHNYVIENE